jgi:hypothetical protein
MSEIPSQDEIHGWLDTLEVGHRFSSLEETALDTAQHNLGYDVMSLEWPYEDRRKAFCRDHPGLVAAIKRECRARTFKVIK